MMFVLVTNARNPGAVLWFFLPWSSTSKWRSNPVSSTSLSFLFHFCCLLFSTATTTSTLWNYSSILILLSKTSIVFYEIMSLLIGNSLLWIIYYEAWAIHESYLLRNPSEFMEWFSELSFAIIIVPSTYFSLYCFSILFHATVFTINYLQFLQICIYLVCLSLCLSTYLSSIIYLSSIYFLSFWLNAFFHFAFSSLNAGLFYYENYLWHLTYITSL